MLNKAQKKIIALSAMGGMLEFYDFTIYGLFSLYFAGQFFPSNDALATIISGYAVFLIGYIARPLGGILFSHIGDEIGRKTVLILTMSLMGIAALGLGLLPTYLQIGILAPISMVFLRLLQGLAIGGELPSMIVYTAESIPEHRAFAMGVIFAGTVAGLIPGMLINLLITRYLTAEQISLFGWRIPFILGGLLCFIAYQVRRKLHETDAFTNLKQRTKFPLGELLRHHLGKLMVGVGLVAIMATPVILAIIFMPSYLIKILHLKPEEVSAAVFVATVISIVATFVMGLFASRFSIYTLMRNSVLLIILAAALCYFMLFKSWNLFLALGVFALLQGALVPLPPILLSHLFPTEIRLTGVALSYNLAFVFFGGLTPIIVTTMIKHTQKIYLTPFICMFCASLITLIALRQYKHYGDLNN